MMTGHLFVTKRSSGDRYHSTSQLCGMENTEPFIGNLTTAPAKRDASPDRAAGCRLSESSSTFGSVQPMFKVQSCNTFRFPETISVFSQTGVPPAAQASPECHNDGIPALLSCLSGPFGGLEVQEGVLYP